MGTCFLVPPAQLLLKQRVREGPSHLSYPQGQLPVAGDQAFLPDAEGVTRPWPAASVFAVSPEEHLAPRVTWLTSVGKRILWTESQRQDYQGQWVRVF